MLAGFLPVAVSGCGILDVRRLTGAGRAGALPPRSNMLSSLNDALLKSDFGRGAFNLGLFFGLSSSSSGFVGSGIECVSIVSVTSTGSGSVSVTDGTRFLGFADRERRISSSGSDSMSVDNADFRFGGAMMDHLFQQIEGTWER